jgi:agmatinase
LTTDFDPDAAAAGDGIFGLPCAPHEARIRLLGVPFEATCSYGGGTAGGPAAILQASRQVDLLDPHFGPVWEAGICLDEISDPIARLDAEARTLAQAVIASGGPIDDGLRAKAARVDALSAERSRIVEAWTRQRLAEGCVPGIVGGDHSCPLGALRAAGAHGAFSILHFDAHLDLRHAYEGFAESHASIMDNVLEQCPRLERLVQVGIRDFCGEERERAVSQGERVQVCYWREWSRRLFEGEAFAALAREAIDRLTDRVWISFDVDGLDPALCPGTGTPVPGGLGFDQAVYVLSQVVARGRTVIGFDLCEVGGSEWDGNVGARLLYKLCGTARGELA